MLLLEGGYDLKALGESVANTFLGAGYLLLSAVLSSTGSCWLRIMAAPFSLCPAVHPASLASPRILSG